MPLRNSWTREMLASIFAEAERNDETRIKLATFSEAERFRFACYNFRRRTGAGANLSFVYQQSFEEGANVMSYYILVKKTPAPKPELVANLESLEP